METETTEATVIKVRCRTNAYYRDRMHERDTVINFYTEDKDTGVYRAGHNKGKPKPEMPKWAEVVPLDTPLTVPDEDGEDVTTLSQMSKKGTPAQQKAAQKVKDDRKTLDAERVAFEKDKAAFEACKNDKIDDSDDGTKKWRGAIKKK